MTRETFAKSYEIYQPLLYNYILHKVKNKEDAEELVQDTFLNCLYYLNQYNEDIASFKTWMFHIAGNKLKNYYRDKKDTILMDFYIYSPQDSKQSLKHSLNYSLNYSLSRHLRIHDFSEDIIDNYTQKMYLEELIPCLNDLQKRVILLRYYNGYSLLEISKMVGRSKENVGVILHRSIRKLRQEIRKQGNVYRI